MITKAIVEQVVDQYNIRVRIPIIDRTSKSSIHTSTKDLNIATICTVPGCAPNLQVGDVVIVAIDDTLDENVVILGHSYRSTPSNTYPDLTVNQLDVNVECKLPLETTIGNVTGHDLQKMTGASANIQIQLNSLLERIQNLEAKLSGEKQ